MMLSPDSRQGDEVTPKIEAEGGLSARLGAESALGEFQQKIHNRPTEQEAKDAFARLVVGRGFNRPLPIPVMTIHSATVAGERPAAKEAPAKQKLLGFLRNLARRLLKRG